MSVAFFVLALWACSSSSSSSPATLLDGDTAVALHDTATPMGADTGDTADTGEVVEEDCDLETFSEVPLEDIPLETMEAILDCLRAEWASLYGDLGGTVGFSVGAESWVAEVALAAQVTGQRGTLLVIFAGDNLDSGFYPNLLLLMTTEPGTQWSRVGTFWPIFSDASHTVWTAVPVVGTAGVAELVVEAEGGVSGTFEFVGSRSGLVPPQEWVVATDGHFQIPIVLDLRLGSG